MWRRTLVQRAARTQSSSDRGAAALAGAKSGGQRFGRGAEEAHVGAQRAAARASGPAKNAGGCDAIEEARLRVASDELLPRGVRPRGIRPRISRRVDEGHCRLRHFDPGRLGHGGNGCRFDCDLRNSAHGNDSRRSPFRAHSDSCAQFCFRWVPRARQSLGTQAAPQGLACGIDTMGTLSPCILVLQNEVALRLASNRCRWPVVAPDIDQRRLHHVTQPDCRRGTRRPFLSFRYGLRTGQRPLQGAEDLNSSAAMADSTT